VIGDIGSTCSTKALSRKIIVSRGRPITGRRRASMTASRPKADRSRHLD
jgi:hypothetical protein